MEPEGPVPCSQESATEPCPETFQFKPHTHILFSQNPFQYFSPIYAQISQVVYLMFSEEKKMY
jgi:hypothetical protein